MACAQKRAKFGLAKRWDHLRGEQLHVRLRPAWRQPGRQGPGVEVGDRHGIRQVADHANRSLGVDHLQQPALPQRLSIIQRWSKRLKAASPEMTSTVAMSSARRIGL